MASSFLLAYISDSVSSLAKLCVDSVFLACRVMPLKGGSSVEHAEASSLFELQVILCRRWFFPGFDCLIYLVNPVGVEKKLNKAHSGSRVP